MLSYWATGLYSNPGLQKAFKVAQDGGANAPEKQQLGDQHQQPILHQRGITAHSEQTLVAGINTSSQQAIGWGLPTLFSDLYAESAFPLLISSASWLPDISNSRP